MPADANGGYQAELVDRTSAGVEAGVGGEAFGACATAATVPEPPNPEDSELCLQPAFPSPSQESVAPTSTLRTATARCPILKLAVKTR